MAIVEATNDNGKKYFKYKEPEWKILYDKVAVLLDSFGMYVNAQRNLTLEDVSVNKPLLAEILVRIDKRKDYFIIFHEDTDMNEIKEAALLAYWLLKFKPFAIKGNDAELHRQYDQINESFARFVLYSALKEKTNRTNNMQFTVSKEYNEKILYAFKFWDISKEALILVAESLNESMYIRKA